MHDFEGETYPGNGDTIGEMITGAEWDGWPLRLFSPAAIIAQEGVTNFVWPHEGRFMPDGKWRFHKGTIMDGKTEVEAPTKPLMVDGSSARAFKLIYQAISDENRAKTDKLCQSRGMFVYFMDKIVWANVRFGG